MKELLKYKLNKSSLLAIFLLLVIAVIVFIPTLKIGFSLVDDAYDILYAKKILENIFGLNMQGLLGNLVESSIGRFRPTYWFWQSCVYLLAGTDPMLHYLFHAILITTTSLIIFKLVYFITKSNLGGLIAGSLFLVVPVNAENWLRLGPAEPLMGFLVITAIYLFLKQKKLTASFIVIALAFFSKETTIAVVPALFIYYFSKRLLGHKKDKRLLKLIMFSLFLLLITVTATFLIRTSYSTFYEFSISDSIFRSKIYLKLILSAFPAATIFVITYLFRNACLLCNKKIDRISDADLIQLFFLSFSVFYILVQSPWVWVLERYLMPATIGLSVFVGIEISKIKTILYGNRKSLAALFLAFIIVLYSNYIVYSLVKINGATKKGALSTQGLRKTLEYLSDNVALDQTVYFNFQKNEATMEPLLESSLHLGLFYQRPDIKVQYLEDKSRAEKDYIVVSGASLGSFPYMDEKKLKMNKNTKDVYVIQQNDRYIILNKPVTILKQLTKKIANYTLNRSKITTDGIFAYYVLKDEWNIYFIK